MARVKRAVNAHKKRRSILKASRGYRDQRSRGFTAKPRAAAAFIHRTTPTVTARLIGGEVPQVVVARINAAARLNDITYNQAYRGWGRGVEVDRKPPPTLRSATGGVLRWSTSPGRCPGVAPREAA